VAFIGTSGLLTQDNTNFFWDDTNNRLGIGISTPLYRLDVSGTSRFTGDMTISGGTQDYIFSKRANVILTLQSQTSGTVSQTEYYAKDGDGTDDVGFAVFAKGIPTDITNFEQFRIVYRNGTQSYTIGTNKGGTGSDRDIRIGNTADPTDLVIKATSGSICINTTTEVASAQVNISSTSKGFLPPRMTTTQKNAIAAPAAGLVVYDTTTNKLCCYNGTAWNDLF
jgi:hypothetical protein